MPHHSERNPAPLEPHSGLDLERDVGRPLRLVPPAHAVGQVEQCLAREQIRLGDGTSRLHAVELGPPNAERRARRRA